MTFTVRQFTDDDKPAYDQLRVTALFGTATPEQLALAWKTRAVTRIFGAFDGDRLIGAAGSYPFTMSVPGGSVTAAGVAGVAVLPTHTRRGALRQLMADVFAQAIEQGEPVSCLWASEPGIYGRFGYGIGTRGLRWMLDRRHGAFAPDVDVGGDVELVDTQDAGLFGPIYARMAETVPGVIARTPEWWDRRLHDPDGTLQAVVTDGGYALYRVSGGWADGGPEHTLTAHEVVAPDRDAYARLWRYLLDVDLVTTVAAGHRPVDDPIQWMLATPRHLQPRLGEGMWIRVLDLPTALSARVYGAPLDVTLAVTDHIVPANQGVWRVVVSGAGGKATVEAVGDNEGDLAVDIAALGAAYLGGVRFCDLARAKRVEERRPGAAAAADRAFLWSPAPWAVTWF